MTKVALLGYRVMKIGMCFLEQNIDIEPPSICRCFDTLCRTEEAYVL